MGSYISVLRPDTPDPYGEDLVARKVWWRVKHPEIKGPRRPRTDEDRLVSRKFCRMQPGGRPVFQRQLAISIGQGEKARRRDRRIPSLSSIAYLKVNSTKSMIWRVGTTHQIARPALSRLPLLIRISLRRRTSQLGPTSAFSRRPHTSTSPRYFPMLLR